MAAKDDKVETVRLRNPVTGVVVTTTKESAGNLSGYETYASGSAADSLKKAQSGNK